MGVKGQTEYKVIVKKNEVVAPEIHMQKHCLMPLSNLDMLLPPVEASSFFCYKKPLEEMYTFEYMVGVLKKALAQTLVTFYVLAGELVKNDVGEPEVLCNNRGVDFAEASADVKLKDLNFYNLDQSVGGKLVPVGKRGLFSVQATELVCGGIVVGCTFDHRVADAYSAHMFLVSWAEIAQGKPLSQIPCFRRSMLLPRRPGHYGSLVNQLYLPISALPPPDQEQQGAIISRVYYIEVDDVNHLQLLANKETENGKNRRTKIEAFSGFLWKTLASSVEKSNDKICRLGIVVDGRSRLAAGEDENLAKSMAAYCGNVLSIPYGEKKCDELKEKPLHWAAKQVHDFLKGALTKEHFLGLTDWVENHRPEPVSAKIYASRVGEDGPAVVVSSGMGFPVAKMDFGWSVSAFSSYYFPWGGQAGYVMPMPSPKGNGDWIIYAHLLKEQLDYIECSEPARLFKPLTAAYLNLI